MGAKSRTKGATAEREFAALLFDELGVKLQRRLRQYQAGGCDLECVEGEDGPVAAQVARYAIEVKRHSKASPALVDGWWKQAASQAAATGRVPALAYRADRWPWRIRVPLAALQPDLPPLDGGTTFTAELSLEGFAALMREGV